MGFRGQRRKRVSASGSLRVAGDQANTRDDIGVARCSARMSKSNYRDISGSEAPGDHKRRVDSGGLNTTRAVCINKSSRSL